MKYNQTRRNFLNPSQGNIESYNSSWPKMLLEKTLLKSREILPEILGTELHYS